MGGKSYFCDYCECYMKNDINVRKVHNTGLSHKIAQTNYQRRHADPQQLLAEESEKVPCSRYHRKQFCKFELFCQYSHYTTKQLEQLRKIVNKLSQKKHKKSLKLRSALEFDWKKTLPWNISNSADGMKYKSKRRNIKLPKNLPQSLKPIKCNKLNDDCLNTEWG